MSAPVDVCGSYLSENSHLAAELGTISLGKSSSNKSVHIVFYGCRYSWNCASEDGEYQKEIFCVDTYQKLPYNNLHDVTAKASCNSSEGSEFRSLLKRDDNIYQSVATSMMVQDCNSVCLFVFFLPNDFTANSLNLSTAAQPFVLQSSVVGRLDCCVTLSPCCCMFIHLFNTIKTSQKKFRCISPACLHILPGQQFSRLSDRK